MRKPKAYKEYMLCSREKYTPHPCLQSFSHWHLRRNQASDTNPVQANTSTIQLAAKAS